jgi:hypothetical protein
MKYTDIKKLVSIITDVNVMRSNKHNHYKTPSSDERAKIDSTTSMNIEFLLSAPD